MTGKMKRSTTDLNPLTLNPPTREQWIDKCHFTQLFQEHGSTKLLVIRGDPKSIFLMNPAVLLVIGMLIHGLFL